MFLSVIATKKAWKMQNPLYKSTKSTQKRIEEKLRLTLLRAM